MPSPQSVSPQRPFVGKNLRRWIPFHRRLHRVPRGGVPDRCFLTHARYAPCSAIYSLRPNLDTSYAIPNVESAILQMFRRNPRLDVFVRTNLLSAAHNPER